MSESISEKTFNDIKQGSFTSTERQMSVKGHVINVYKKISKSHERKVQRSLKTKS